MSFLFMPIKKPGLTQSNAAMFSEVLEDCFHLKSNYNVPKTLKPFEKKMF